MTSNSSVSYTYDAENRLVSSAGYTYSYDGDGNRVMKSNGSTGTIYWRGADGEVIDEGNLSDIMQEEYVFFGGKRVVRWDVPTGHRHYYFSDHLGSANVVASNVGVIEDESDYYPYGGEIPVTNTYVNTYKFTGKERDAETGLDNFGARFYTSNIGRFMTPDWAARPIAVPYAVYGDPQTLNLYTYVENAPINRADADGHCPFADKGGGACENVQVTSEVSQKPKVVQNQTSTKSNGEKVKWTGVEGKLIYTVNQNGKPVDGASVKENVQESDTRNGKVIPGTVITGHVYQTNADGQFQDTLSVGGPTDGTKNTNNAIKADLQNNTWAAKDKQTLTITLPRGGTCSMTNERVLTNAGPNGPSAQYSILKTDVTPNQ